LAAQFAVDLLFKANTSALSKVSNQLQGVEGTANKLKGQNPFQGIERGAKGAGDAAVRAGKQAESAAGGFNRLSTAVGGLVSAYAVLAAGKFVFAKTAELETQTKSLQVLTGSLEKAKTVISELQQFASVTPFTSTDLIETAKRLKAFGVDSEKLVDTTKRLGDVAGATGAELSGVATAYGQIQAKGRLQGEELLQLQERGINLQDELQKMYGLTGEEFREALEKGQISAKAVELALKRLTDAGGKYANGAVAQSDTLSGKFSTLQDGIDSLARRLGEVLMPTLKGILDYANQALDSINRVLAAGRGGAFSRNIAYAGNQITFGATSQGVDSLEKLIGQITPQSNKVGIEQNLQVLRQAQTSLRRIPATDPNAARAQSLQGVILGKIDQNLEALKKVATTPAASAAKGSFTPPPLLNDKSGASKSVEKAVRKGVIGGMTGGGQGDASRGRSTGPHLHAQLVRGGNLEAMVDSALDFGGGRTASSFGLGRGAASHGYPGRDYYTPQGTPFTLKPGWSATDMGIQGALGRGMRISGPGGVFELGHLAGVKTGDLNGKGAAGDMVNAQQDALDNYMESQKRGEDLLRTFNDQLDTLVLQGTKGEELGRIQRDYLARQREIGELADPMQRADAEALSLRIKQVETTREEVRLLYEQLDASELLNQSYGERAFGRGFDSSTVASGFDPSAPNLDPNVKQGKIADYMNELRTQLADTEGMIVSLAGTIQSQLASSLSNAITGLIQGTATIKEVFSDLFANIGNAFIQMATQILSQKLILSVLGLFGGSSGSGLFSGAGPFALPGGGGFNGFGLDLFASGGSTPVNTPVLVGERGPEMFVPGQSGGITNAQNLRSMMNSQGSKGSSNGAQVNMNMSFQTTRFMDRDWVDQEQLQAAMAQATKKGAERGEQRALDKLRQSPRNRRAIGL
jgi:hypothetical protein